MNSVVKNKNNLDSVLIILAGGVGTRMKIPSSIIHKSAMPVYDESVLQRNLRQAVQAGFKKIIISTHPTFVNLLSKIIAMCFPETGENRVEVLSNEKHEDGPLPALLYILEIFDLPQITLSLSDIFFIENPFHLLRKNSISQTNTLAVTDLFDKKELFLGGIVICNTVEIKSIVESPTRKNSKGVRWSGAAIFDCNLKQHLKEFLLFNQPDSRIGDFFEYCRVGGEQFKALWVSDFINVNTSDDLFVASLYRAIELNDNNRNVIDKLKRIIQLLRNQSLERQMIKLYDSYLL